ncbi:four helix bundle protein [Fluviicola sp.]|uniref:four helix bundle protein n=1 Tax=Fluviicola sp. TaxID=1917219 RepID=UPI0031CEAE1C
MITNKQDIRERSFDFALSTVKNCRRIKERHKEFILTDQLVRSSTSVGANMREARNAESKADFIHKLSICQKECDESIYWLELLMALLNEEKEHLLTIHDEANQLLRIIKTISLRTKENSKWTKR